MSDDKMTSQRKIPDASWVAIGVVLTVMLAAGAYYVMSRPVETVQAPGPKVVTPEGPGSSVGQGAVSDFGFVQSANVDDFKSWLASGPQGDAYYGITMGRGMAMETMAVDSAMMAPTAMDGAVKTQTSGTSAVVEADRYSSTNVQIVGIDEPDRVKTDGKSIYYAPERRYWPPMRAMTEPMMVEDGVSSAKMIASAPDQGGVEGAVTVQALPIDDLAVLSHLDHTGELLLSDDTLMVFDYEGVYGYDVTDPADPGLAWQYEYNENNSLQAARLKDGQLYIITRSYLNRNQPCPIQPLVSESSDVVIQCGDIWHESQPSEVDTTFSIVVVDPSDGSVKRSTAFVGTNSYTNVAMFADNIYVTSGLSVDALDFMTGFLNDNSDLVPSATLAHLNAVMGYDLSLAAKQAELGYALERWLGSLSDDDRLMTENEMSNRLSDYWWKHAREIGGTGIVKVGAADLDIKATGRVPGNLLNQFAIDEDDGYLRVAVTVGGRNNPLSWQFGIGRDESISDVYVLDPELKMVGSAQGMGEGERIYSVRFVGKRGYVVTFKETDPFYVLDLSEPKNPVIAGELKIPGYSSYLHPLTDDVVLGVGKEGSQVKLSMFDISDSANPTEVAKYNLDEYWSDVLGTHHAFLQDAKHGVFFMPGSKGGYIFSYSADELRIEKAVSGVSVNRAVYINDYLYLVSDDEIIVLDERDWQKVGTLKLR